MSHRPRIRLGIAVALLACAVVPPGAARADEVKPGPLPGHSVHGETFDAGPRRAAYLMPGTGDVRFPVTTHSADAQRFFDQGMGQLHGFWYLEAERSFRQAATLDRDCAMAYWGMAMANFNNAKRAKGFIAEAAKRVTPANTPVELNWIDALNAFYRDEPKDDDARKRNFVAAVDELAAAFPDDVEAKALCVRFRWEYRSSLPKGGGGGGDRYAASDKLLEEIFARSPMHPAHHYRIHLWDDKDASRAVTAAARNGPAAPGIAHMWHMPGHTYSKLNRYADAAFAQEASARVDHAYMARDRVMPYEIHNYAHNNEWLVRDLVYCGRVAEAVDLATNLTELPRHPDLNGPTKPSSAAAMGRARLIDVLAAHEQWDALLAACEPGGPLGETADGVTTPDYRVRRLRYIGVAAAAAGNADRATAAIVELETLRAALRVESFRAGAKAAADAKGKNPGEVAKARAAAQKDAVDRIAAVGAAVAHVAGQQAIAAGDYASAIELWNTAGVDAPAEQMAVLHLKAGDPKKAAEVAKKAVDSKKNQTLPLAAQVEVLHAAGKADEAKAAFAALRMLSAKIDLTAPPYARLTPIAAEFGHPGDWRVAANNPPDVPDRVAVDTLGPFRWSPWPAPDFSAPAADGSHVSLAAYRGRPVVVLFYLGHACLHCTRQLQAFAPMTKRYADAGISIVAVSTDAPADLHRAWEAAKVDGGGPAGDAFPFPLASDARFEVFRRYDCYDDFEKMPLHGTFLIDAAGRVRWRDVGADPFTNAQFVLDESKRLLAQPAGK